MKIREILAKSIITKSNLPDSDYVINPYTGCTHACIYCYATFMQRFSGHAEKWGTFVDAKINSHELIPQNTNKYKGKRIFISSVTDPYLHIERKYYITRRILENLVSLEPNLSILTKSDLVLRDIEILKQFKKCEVGFSIAVYNDNLRKEIDQFASPINKRIEALKQLKEYGIRTFVFIGPILPYLTDWKQIILETKACADYYLFENLNIKGIIWDSIKYWLITKHPELLKKYENIYFSNNNYWDKVEEDIKEFLIHENIQGKIYFHHKDNKKTAGKYEQQSFA